MAQIKIEEGLGFYHPYRRHEQNQAGAARDYQHLSRLWKESQKTGENLLRSDTDLPESDFGVCSLRITFHDGD